MWVEVKEVDAVTLIVWGHLLPICLGCLIVRGHLLPIFLACLFLFGDDRGPDSPCLKLSVSLWS